MGFTRVHCNQKWTQYRQRILLRLIYETGPTCIAFCSGQHLSGLAISFQIAPRWWCKVVIYSVRVAIVLVETEGVTGADGCANGADDTLKDGRVRAGLVE